AISDINKAMALYAQPTEFDQNAWKTAFDIANNFATTSENHRKNRENLATEDWRTAFENNKFETGIGKNNVELANLQRLYNNALKTDPSEIQSQIALNKYNTTQHDIGNKALLGQDELLKLRAQFGKPGETQMEFYNKLPEEVRKTVSPYAYYGFDNAAAQERARKDALMQGVLQSAEKMAYDPLTNERVRTGQYDSNLLDFGLNKLIASGAMNKEEAEALRKKVMPVDLAAYTIPKLDLSVPFGQLPIPQQVTFPYRLDTQPPQVAAQSTVPITVEPTALPEKQNGIMMNGRFIPSEGQSKNLSDLFSWLEIEKAKSRGQHW
ncbi:hypothetical protein, partial [Rodentibacter genomosp. 2]|uniref:hypothetical protein n=1 Tax=Rodentibacter genomosp. 2 TaxID=1908266 RepID=UPI0015C3CE9C